MRKIYAVQGDNLPLVTLTITDLDDNPVSLAGCTGANAYMRKLGETTVQIIVTTVDAHAGTLSFDFSNGELAEAGEYEIEVELDFSGKKQTLYRPIKLSARAQFA